MCAGPRLIALLCRSRDWCVRVLEIEADTAKLLEQRRSSRPTSTNLQSVLIAHQTRRRDSTKPNDYLPTLQWSIFDSLRPTKPTFENFSTESPSLVGLPSIQSKLLLHLRRHHKMISDNDLYTLSIFLGSCAMLLIVLYHFLEVNADDSANAELSAELKNEKSGVGAVKPRSDSRTSNATAGLGVNS